MLNNLNPKSCHLSIPLLIHVPMTKPTPAPKRQNSHPELRYQSVRKLIVVSSNPAASLYPLSASLKPLGVLVHTTLLPYSPSLSSHFCVICVPLTLSSPTPSSSSSLPHSG